MRNHAVWGWHGLALAALLLSAGLPGRAQLGPPPTEVRLNGIVLGWNATEVIKYFKAMPHYIGPAKASAGEAMLTLDPPPLATEAAAMASSGATISGANGPTVDEVAERLQKMIVWVYVGNGKVPDPSKGWTTYIFFGPQGTVQAVAVLQTKVTAKPPIEIGTDGSVTFGTRLMDLVSGKRYDWPEPLRKIEDYLFCAYPKFNVTYSVSSSTRRVVGIAIGLPIAISTDTTAGAR